MGSLTVNEILKLLKALDKTNKLKKKRKRRAKKIKNTNDGYIKSTSDHMYGNIITNSNIRDIQNMEKLINNYQKQGISYLQNYEDRLYKIENKNKNDLSNIPNQSLSRYNIKNYSNSTDNADVPISDPDDNFHIESSLVNQQNTNDELKQPNNNILSYFYNLFTPKKKDDKSDTNNQIQEDETPNTTSRQFSNQQINNQNTSYLLQNINEDEPIFYDSNDDNIPHSKIESQPIQQLNENELRDFSEQKHVDIPTYLTENINQTPSNDENKNKDDDKNSDNDKNIVVDDGNDDGKIVDVSPNTNIIEANYTPEEKKYNDIFDKYYNDKTFKDDFDATYFINDDGDIVQQNKNKPATQDMNDNEKNEFVESAKHFKINVRNIKKKGAAYAVIHKHKTNVFDD
jgi:hypothetical protein